MWIGATGPVARVLRIGARVLQITTRQQLAKINTACSVTVGEYDIDPSLCVRNLGVWFDSHLSMSTYVTKRGNSSFYHLHNIRCIRKYLSRDSLLVLIHSFITSRLDFCNGLLYGLPKSQNVKLQRIQNAAARLAMNIGKYSHVTLVKHSKIFTGCQFALVFILRY